MGAWVIAMIVAVALAANGVASAQSAGGTVSPFADPYRVGGLDWQGRGPAA